MMQFYISWYFNSDYDPETLQKEYLTNSGSLGMCSTCLDQTG